MVTFPGIHPDCDLGIFPPRIRTAINKISLDFYVTRTFKPEKIGNSEYWAVLARPTDHFAVQLNADRELLFLFSEYNAFEIRTLEAYDEFYALLEQKRVDKSIRFLISEDLGIESIIQHYLNQHPEYPIIVPLTFASLASGPEGLISAVRRNYVIRDLFAYQNPLREETFFFGRQDLVAKVIDLSKSGQSSSMFGLRKSGKTSAIYAIQRKSRSFGIRTVLVDCQNPAVHAVRYSGLLSEIVDKVRESVGVKRSKISFPSDPAEVSKRFSSDMKSILGQAKSKILIIFDEIENITPGSAASKHWSLENDALLFWQILRSFIQSGSNGNMSICLVGTSPKLLEVTELAGVANPMYLFCQRSFIPNFGYDETREMIDRLGFFMGLSFSPSQVARIQTDYGGHPFFIRQVCSQVHRLTDTKRPKSVSDRKLREAMDSFQPQLDAYLKDILENLKESYRDEYDLLESIVQGDMEEVNEYANEAPDLIDHLAGYGILERQDDEVVIRFEALKIAISRAFKEGESNSQWAELSKRRNPLEREIRRQIFVLLRGRDVIEWSTILSESLSRDRWNNIKQLELREIFGDQSPLYFSDIISLVKKSSLFEFLGDEKSSIVIAMDRVNKYRADAHAKLLSDDEYESLMLDFSLLEEKFLF